MKAEYILAAIESMKTVEDLLCNFKELTTKDRWRVATDLMDARIDLMHYSGLSEKEVEVEE